MKTIAGTTLITLPLLLLIACSEQQTSPKAAPSKAPVTAQAAIEHTDKTAGEEIYAATCAACHDTGVAGAPKLGDKEAWAEHSHHGMEHMLEAVIKGKEAMPPRGGNPKLTDDEIRSAIEYILSKSK